MDTLLLSAGLPVVALCYFIYQKDNNKEPMDLLMKLLGLGALITIPVIIGELAIGKLTDVEGVKDFITIFTKVFFGVALFEEGFKWLVVKYRAYNNREFDEVYDIIVYSVFVSLGFALVENIGYVLLGGLGTAIMRAILSVPGHACFAVLMGYYFSRAKVASISNNKSLCTRSMIYSLLIPMLFHTMYDALLEWYINTNIDSLILIFLLFDVIMVVICFITVNRTSKVQQNISNNLAKGNIVNDNGVAKVTVDNTINFCPVCGNNVINSNYCGRCGLKIR